MTLRTLNYGNYGIFLIMGNAGFCPSTVVVPCWGSYLESYKVIPKKGTTMEPMGTPNPNPGPLNPKHQIPTLNPKALNPKVARGPVVSIDCSGASLVMAVSCPHSPRIWSFRKFGVPLKGSFKGSLKGSIRVLKRV